jgi:DNA-binding SARP family transcriptional activator
VRHYLALPGDRGAQREEVIEAVWPDRDPQKGRVLLRAALAEVRRRLEPGRQTGESSRYLETTGDRVSVDAVTDIAEARALAAAGDAAAAFSLFRGDLLDDNPYVEWVFDERRSAEALRLELAERVVADPAVDGATRTRAAEMIVAAEPWRTEVFDQLAAAHRAAGDEAAARAAERRRESE